ncbi:hypothetical protein ZIOFF_039243 [Zingiber officinale]|uniref:Protein kinase domain-containing protein n=1 Tax=Zingiber officinale TaxID=94328 RepID=A0A8J5G2Y6_ZINOF|nr:hypothetical protein ZIOFF_039243 [Zingiber officinale]
MNTSQIKRRIGKYELGGTIGEGTFAKVKFARNIKTGEPVAIKILDKEKVLKHKLVEQPENLLLDAYGNLNVSDFRLSALSQQVKDDGLLHTTCGTPNYVAPEVLNDRGYDGATTDLWSWGVILFVLLTGIDSSTHSPPNRIGQVSHSVVLGIVNISDQREVMGLLPDIRRVFSSEVVGVVLLSLGAGILSPVGANNTPLVSYIVCYVEYIILERDKFSSLFPNA